MNRLGNLAMVLAVAGTVAAGGSAVGVGTASADGPSYNGGNCPGGMTCTHWCPGDPLPPGSQVLGWDWNVCHDWYWNSEGIADVTTNVMYPWSGPPHPAAPLPPVVAPPPPPPPAPHPFCSPRGVLFPIPPICDEIGIDDPPGSVAARESRTP